MKIVLINPPFFDVYKGYEKAARIGACYPPLGLLYLAANLEKDGHEVKLFDIDVETIKYQEIVYQIKNWEPDLIGITATTPLFHKAAGIAGDLKKILSAPIVIGGYHITILKKEEFSKHKEFDYAVIGEGEITFSELVKCIGLNGDLNQVKGILFRNRRNEIVRTEIRPLIADLDILPFPARHLIDTGKYLWTPPAKGVVPIATILTKRGCPFRCSFCSQSSMFTRNVRFRSVPNVLDELEEIVNKEKINHIIFLDDTLVIRRDRMMELCKGIHERRLAFTWEGMARANLVDKELIDTMAKAGLVRMSFGIESGDEEVLKRIEKGITLAQIRQAYEWVKQAGIETRGSAIIGHPGETKKSAWKTIFFLRSLKHLDQAYLNIMVPYPGTEVYNLAKKGEAGYKLLSDDYHNYIRYNQSVLEVNDLNIKSLKFLQNIGLWLFYLTPGRIYYNLKRAGIKNGFKMALAMLQGLLSKPE